VDFLNVINSKPYHYFNEIDYIIRIEELKKGLAKDPKLKFEPFQLKTRSKGDSYLFFAGHLLSILHDSFFTLHEKGENPDIRQICRLARRTTLRGKKVMFSGIFSVDEDPKKSKLFHILTKLGGEMINSYDSAENLGQKPKTANDVDCIVSNAYMHTKKMREGKLRKIPIVHKS